MSYIRSLHCAALDQFGLPAYPESVADPGENPQEKENEHIEVLQNALSVLEGLKDISNSHDRMHQLLLELQQQIHRHLTQGPQANAPNFTTSRLSPTSCSRQSSATPSPLALSQIARDYDVNGQYHQADAVDAQIVRLAQSQMQTLLNQGVDGVGAIGSGMVDAAQGAWNVSQSLNPVNWAGAETGDAVSATNGWFVGKVNDAVEQRMRAMGLDPNKQYHGTPTPTPATLSPASATSAPAVTPPAAPQPSGASPAVSQGASPAAEDASLVTRYLGWAFDAVSRKRLPSATVRADLASYLASNRQSEVFTQTVLQQFDARIGSQQAVKRQDAEWVAGRVPVR